jgi:hypothetical protein
LMADFSVWVTEFSATHMSGACVPLGFTNSATLLQRYKVRRRVATTNIHAGSCTPK